MNKNLVTLVLILILVVIIVAASIFIMKGKPTEAPGAHAGDPVPTAAPPRESETPSAGGEGGQSGESGGGTAEPIATREPLVTPEPTPVPTPEPTPVPTPKPTPVPADAEGSFSSNTGTGLNLRVDWQTYKDASGSRKLKADVSIVSYSIFTSGQYKSITLKIGGNAWSADCPGVSYDGKDQIVTKAASFTVDAPAPGTAATVEWYYGGSYSGKDLTYITATGTIQ